MAIDKKHKASGVIVLLALIFIVPMIAAWFSYANGWFLSSNTVNHGQLLSPPIAISGLFLRDEQGRDVNFPLKGKWSLVYMTGERDADLTRRNLYYIRQIRQATGKDRDRIERAIITTDSTEPFSSWLQRYYPGTYHFVLSPERMQQFEAELPKKLALKKGSLYLVDPLGNIVLFYAPDAPPKGILKDLQRVLKVSQIG